MGSLLEDSQVGEVEEREEEDRGVELADKEDLKNLIVRKLVNGVMMRVSASLVGEERCHRACRKVEGEKAIDLAVEVPVRMEKSGKQQVRQVWRNVKKETSLRENLSLLEQEEEREKRNKSKGESQPVRTRGGT